MTPNQELFRNEAPEPAESPETSVASEGEGLDFVDEAADIAASFVPLEHPADFEWNQLPPKDPSFALKGGFDRTKPGFGTFELNLTRSLAQQLGPFFDSLPTAALTRANLAAIDDGVEGVYALYIDDTLSYVGKSDARRGLKSRLRRHRRKLSNRTGLNVDSVRFKAAQIYSFAAIDVEGLLLRLARQRKALAAYPTYKEQIARWDTINDAIKDAEPSLKGTTKTALKQKRKSGVPLTPEEDAYAAWLDSKEKHRDEMPIEPTLENTKPPFLNNSGFGSNDTGTKRDTQKTSDFDLKYPLDMDSEIDAFAADSERAGENESESESESDKKKTRPPEENLYSALQWLRPNLGFTFRVQSGAKHAFRSIRVDRESLFTPDSMRNLLARISAELPEGWCISLLLGKVLVYEKDGKSLESVQMHFEGGRECRPDAS